MLCGSTKALAITLVLLSFPIQSVVAAETETTGQTKTHEAVASERKRISLVSGLANGLLGLRYHWGKDRIRYFVSAGVLYTLNIGMEHRPKNTTKHGFEYYLGTHFVLQAWGAGAKWMWHPSGFNNRGFSLGLGVSHIFGNEQACFIGCGEIDRLTFADLSINYKF